MAVACDRRTDGSSRNRRTRPRRAVHDSPNAQHRRRPRARLASRPAAALRRMAVHRVELGRRAPLRAQAVTLMVVAVAWTALLGAALAWECWCRVARPRWLGVSDLC